MCLGGIWKNSTYFFQCLNCSRVYFLKKIGIFLMKLAFGLKCLCFASFFKNLAYFFLKFKALISINFLYQISRLFISKSIMVCYFYPIGRFCSKLRALTGLALNQRFWSSACLMSAFFGNSQSSPNWTCLTLLFKHDLVN
jgi:hypothetical protein